MESTTASEAAGGTALRNDPITFEVLRNGFKSICNEASALIERVSYAPTITEGHDYSVSILTPDSTCSCFTNGSNTTTCIPKARARAATSLPIRP